MLELGLKYEIIAKYSNSEQIICFFTVCFSLQSKQINFLLGLLTELQEKHDTKLCGEKGWCRGRQ